MSLSQFTTSRPVTTIIIVMGMVISGLFSMINMKQELMPNFDFPIVVVSTRWDGSTPEDINSQVTKQIEDSVVNVEGIKSYSSISNLGISIVIVQFDFGTDVKIKRMEIQAEIDKVKENLPTDVKEPIVSEFDMSQGSGNLVLLLNISGKDKVELTSFVEDTLEPTLKRNKGIGEVSIFGGSIREIRVEVDPYRLKAFGLSPVELYGIIKASDTIIPSGFVKEGGKEFIVRVMGEIKTLDDVENIIITNFNGQLLKLKDVAKVEFTTKDMDTYAKLNGEDAISVSITKTKDGNIVEISEIAKQQLKELESFLPKGTKVEIIEDLSENVTDSISNIYSTIMEAIIIASLILLFFLRDIKSTLVIMLSLPVILLFSFFLMSLAGVTINMMSLMALSLSVGSLIDNAIVALENIYRHITEEKATVLDAAVNGTAEITGALFAGTATNVVVFFPIIMKAGMAREVFHSLSLTIIFAHSTSIVVALLFVPLLASKFLKREKIIKTEHKLENGGFSKLREKYKGLLRKVLNHRKAVILTVLFAFIASIFVGATAIRFTFMPNVDDKKYSIIAELSKGLDIKQSQEVAVQLEKIVSEDEATEKYSSIIQKDSAIVNVDSKSKESIFKTMDRIREKTRDIPGVNISLSSETSVSSSSSRDYQFIIKGDDIEELNKLSVQMMEKMRKEGWFQDITSSYEGGNPQARIIIDRAKAKMYGISVTDVSALMSMNVLGLDPIDITSGNSTIDVTVMLEEKYRNTIDGLLELDVKTAQGSFIKLREIAMIQEVEGPSSITKESGLQTITVGANIGDRGMNEAGAFMNSSFKELNPPKGYTASATGESETFGDVLSDLGTALLISIVLMYAIMAIQLESFDTPLIIMGTLPLTIIGVVFGLLITNTNLDMLVMIGIIMLMGMVVNNAIILLDFIGALRKEGVELIEAVVRGCGTRLRAITMTACSVVFGWLPMALKSGSGADYYKGMAIAVIFGYATSTILTMIFVPVIYTSVEEMKLKLKARKNRKTGGTV